METTKRHYLAPVARLRPESILAVAESTDEDKDVEDLDGVFARLARETAAIQDNDPLVAAA
ncbi:hypothetical protein [Streptomyces sp. NBC_01314]|uniref:hypothetical protein n=1 Tax=Streptomyces sp. NBC_01314 TaxID=2903821 RepID=UPI00308E59DC|nr:hypothetical protein OG622_07295 [Streptomyces sp. NBC_01314]